MYLFIFLLSSGCNRMVGLESSDEPEGLSRGQSFPNRGLEHPLQKELKIHEPSPSDKYFANRGYMRLRVGNQKNGSRGDP